MLKANTKATLRAALDADIVRLNSVGLSLKTISDIVGIHPTSVTARLKALGVPPADTRRTFMEDVVRQLTDAQVTWLSDVLGSNITVKDYVKKLIIDEYLRHKDKKKSDDN